MGDTPEGEPVPQAAVASETAQMGEQGEGGRPPRRNRPRPRGGARERERRERQQAKKQQQPGDGSEAVAPELAPAENADYMAAAPPAAVQEGGGGERRGGRQEGRRRERNRGRERSGQPGGGGREEGGGRGRGMRLAWRSAVDDAGQPLSREKLWETATTAAAAAPESGEPSTAVGGSGGEAQHAPLGRSAEQQEGGDGTGSGDGFEAGHILEIARDPKSGDLLGVREIWLAPGARRRPRAPRHSRDRSGAGNEDPALAEGAAQAASGADAGGGGSPQPDDHEHQAAAAERLIQELGINK